MSYKSALAALAIFMACGPALAQNVSGAPPQNVSGPPPSTQQGPPPQETTTQDRDACASDVKKLCGELVDPRPGDNRVLSCLLKHEKELTEACKKNVASHRAVLPKQ
jgi:hypothetical protein